MAFYLLAAASFVVDYTFAVSSRPHSIGSPSPLHVYIHVPKCAGTSFSDAMRLASHSTDWWPTDRLASGCAERRAGESAEEDFTLTSHCGLSELETCIRSGRACYHDGFRKPVVPGQACPALVPASAPLRFVMLVRDPVQRVLSEYYFFKRSVLKSLTTNINNTQPLYKFVTERLWTPLVRYVALNGSITDWVQAHGNPAHNAMTKAVVTGKAGLQAPVLRQAAGHASACAFYDSEDYSAHWQKYYGKPHGVDVEALINSDSKLLKLAVAVIEERFDFVGVVERFDESVSRFGALLGIQPVAREGFSSAEAHTSDKPADDEVPADVLQEVRARNKLDTGLYIAVLHGKFWKGSTAASKSLVTIRDTPLRKLTWQSVLDGDREGEAFNPSVFLPTVERH